MTATRMWGVSDPLRAGRGATKGAAKWGSLTPHWTPARLGQRRGLRNRRHQNAAGVRPEAADWQEHRTSFVLHKAKRAVGSASESVSGKGNGAPEFRFPHPVPPSQVQASVTRGGSKGVVTFGSMVRRKTVRPPRVSTLTWVPGLASLQRRRAAGPVRSQRFSTALRRRYRCRVVLERTPHWCEDLALADVVRQLEKCGHRHRPGHATPVGNRQTG